MAFCKAAAPTLEKGLISWNDYSLKHLLAFSFYGEVLLRSMQL